MVYQQNTFYIDLEQRDEDGRSFLLLPLFCIMYFCRSDVLEWIKYCREKGFFGMESNPHWILGVVVALGRLACNVPLSKETTISGLPDLPDIVSWLASFVTVCMYTEGWDIEAMLSISLGYDCGEKNDPVDFKEHDKTSLIRLWLAILQEANIDLHSHFRDAEGCLDHHRIPDLWHHRKGVERILTVEYGSDPDDVTISVRDVRVKIPPEESIPGAWKAGEAYLETGLEVEGLEPTANWRVSTKEDRTFLSRKS